MSLVLNGSAPSTYHSSCKCRSRRLILHLPHSQLSSQTTQQIYESKKCCTYWVWIWARALGLGLFFLSFSFLLELKCHKRITNVRFEAQNSHAHEWVKRVEMCVFVHANGKMNKSNRNLCDVCVLCVRVYRQAAHTIRYKVAHLTSLLLLKPIITPIHMKRLNEWWAFGHCFRDLDVVHHMQYLHLLGVCVPYIARLCARKHIVNKLNTKHMLALDPHKKCC